MPSMKLLVLPTALLLAAPGLRAQPSTTRPSTTRPSTTQSPTAEPRAFPKAKPAVRAARGAAPSEALLRLRPPAKAGPHTPAAPAAARAVRLPAVPDGRRPRKAALGARGPARGAG